MTVQAERPQSVPADPARPGSWWPAAVAGLVAAAAALGAGELVGAFFAPSPGPVIGVANRVIDRAPTWFVEFGKSIFGLADKPALILGTIIISLILGVALGIASRHNRLIGAAGIAGFGIVGLLAVAVDPQGSIPAAIVVALDRGRRRGGRAVPPAAACRCRRRRCGLVRPNRGDRRRAGRARVETLRSSPSIQPPPRFLGGPSSTGPEPPASPRPARSSSPARSDPARTSRPPAAPSPSPRRSTRGWARS